MERFIRRENIKRYRKLLRDAKDEAERRLIQNLLTEAEQKEPAEKTLARHVPLKRASAVLSDLQKRPKSKV
jgi:Sec-independent protein translocase protein TatA